MGTDAKEATAALFKDKQIDESTDIPTLLQDMAPQLQALHGTYVGQYRQYLNEHPDHTINPDAVKYFETIETASRNQQLQSRAESQERKSSEEPIRTPNNTQPSQSQSNDKK